MEPLNNGHTDDGPSLLSFAERLSSFGSYFFIFKCTEVRSVPFVEKLSSFGSYFFIFKGTEVRSVLYQRLTIVKSRNVNTSY